MEPDTITEAARAAQVCLGRTCPAEADLPRKILFAPTLEGANVQGVTFSDMSHSVEGMLNSWSNRTYFSQISLAVNQTKRTTAKLAIKSTVQ